MGPVPPESAYSEIDPLYPEARQLSPDEHPFDVPHVYRCQSMLIEPAIYLNALLRDFFIAGGKIVVRDFADARALSSLAENLLFNCTGLGARTLFRDEELIPIRGQLTFLLPQPEVDYMTLLAPGTFTCFRGGMAYCSAAATIVASGDWSRMPRSGIAFCVRTLHCSTECEPAPAGRLAQV